MAPEPAGSRVGDLQPPPSPRALHPAIWGLILLAAYVGVQATVLAVAYVALAAAEGSLTRLPREAAGGNLSMFPLPGLSEGSTAFVLLAGVLASALVAIPLSVMAHRNRFGSLRGFWARPSLRAVGYGLLGATLLLGFLVALGAAAQAVAGDRLEESFRSRPQSELTRFLARPALLAMAIPVAGLLAPVAEEFVFRGFFHRILQEWLGALNPTGRKTPDLRESHPQEGTSPTEGRRIQGSEGRRGVASDREPMRSPRRAFWGAALLSSLLWGAVHGDPVLLPLFVPIGAVLSWTLVRSGTVLAPVIAHQMYNTLQLVILVYLPQWV